MEKRRRLARQEYPGDPTAEGRYRSHYIQQMGQQLHAENMTSQANWNILNAALNGPNAIKSEQDLLTNPRLVDAYNAILKTDPSAYRVVNNAINANALAMWDPPATAQTNQLHDTLNGMKDTDRARFSNLNLLSYYGGMPVAQLNSLIDAQDRIRKNDATEAAKHTNLISSISAVKYLTIQAAASAESPFYKMDRTSLFLPEQQKWNGFVSKYGQVLDDWQQNNNGKIPTDIQEREIARGILFPNGMPGQQTSTEIHDLTNKQRLDDTGRAYAPEDQSAPDQPAAQKKKPEDSWFWQTMESSGTLKPYAERMREYVESPTDTEGAWDWLTSTVPKSGAQLSVSLARTPFDLAQTFSSGSQAAIEKFLKEHPEYEELAREDPTGQSLETLSAIGAGAGLLDAVEAAAKGAAASIGKPLGIDTKNQTWSWENFKDAWVNHPVESLVAVIPFGAAFLKRKGITPSETQVRELVDSAVKDEKTPLAQELKNVMEQGPPKEEVDFPEDSVDAPKSGATVGLPEAEAPTAYSVAFETKIHPSGAGTRAAHFRAANDALLSAMEASPELAERMSQLRIEVPRTASGAAKGVSPYGWTWHHTEEPGVMQLVPRDQHAAGNPFRETMHPNGRGGFAIWGTDF